MESATITPRYVNEPKQEGWSGSIKDTGGNYWNIPADKVDYYKQFLNKPIVISYETKGKFRHVKGMLAQEKPAPAATKNNAGPPLDDRGGVPPHVSNWVAHAISAGLLKEPHELCNWAQWAYEAGRSMTQAPSSAMDHAPNEPEF